MNFYPLGKVKEMIETIGFDISYAYEDLVFSDHSLFILQFSEKNPELLGLFFNTDCVEEERKRVAHLLLNAAQTYEFTIIEYGKFTLTQNEENEELTIQFTELLECCMD